MERIFIACLTLLLLIGCKTGSTDKPAGELEPIRPLINASELEATMCPGELPSDALLVDGYYQLSVCEWPVYMNTALYNDDKAKQVFDALRVDLGVVQSRLPTQIALDLRSVNVWLELDVPTTAGGVYHPSQLWLEENGYPTKWAKGVQIGNAQNYLNWRQQQPAIILHELAHAFDDQYFNSENPTLIAAFEEAKLAGIYQSVAFIEAEQGLLEAYALTNAKEYFAELTEAYFWTNDFFPFTRQQLQQHDAAGFNAVRTMWDQQ